MFEGLNDVQWGALHDSAGIAHDIPCLLEDLRSASDTVRKNACNLLFDRINPQGSGMQVTPYVVPFLFELIQAQEVKDREELVRGLVSIAIGMDSDYLPYSFDLEDFRSHFVRRAKKIPGNRKKESHFGPHMQLECYEAVNERAFVFVHLLDDAAIAVRCSSAFAVCWFPECKDSLRALESHLESTSLCTHERASFQLSYAALSYHLRQPIREGLIEPYLKSDDRILLAASAIALALQYPNDETVGVVLAKSASDPRLQNVYALVQFNEGDLQDYAEKVLKQKSPVMSRRNRSRSGKK